MLVKDIVVSLAVISALNVVCNCNAAIDTPPTGNLTSLNLTWSFTCRPLLKNETVSVVLAKDKNLQFLHQNLTKETRKIVRPYIKIYDFASDDRFKNKYCPCGGDELFNSCCAK